MNDSDHGQRTLFERGDGLLKSRREIELTKIGDRLRGRPFLSARPAPELCEIEPDAEALATACEDDGAEFIVRRELAVARLQRRFHALPAARLHSRASHEILGSVS